MVCEVVLLSNKAKAQRILGRNTCKYIDQLDLYRNPGHTFSFLSSEFGCLEPLEYVLLLGLELIGNAQKGTAVKGV